LFSFIQNHRIIPTIQSGLFSEPIIKAIINNIYQFLIKFILPTCLILGFIIISLDYGLKTLKLSKTFTIPIENITSVASYNYVIVLPISSIFTGDTNNSSESPTLLLDGATQLNKPHSLHSDISTKGFGRYSHFHKHLYFSTYDGTDPRTNGRQISVKLFYVVHPLIAKLGKIFIMVAFGLFLLLYINNQSAHIILKWKKLQQYLFAPVIYKLSKTDTKQGIHVGPIHIQHIHLTMILLFGCGLFLLPLINAWMLFPIKPTNDVLYGAMGGLIPWVDAGFYYEEANRLLETGQLDYFGTRRPLNAILFALRLWATKGNFEFALIIQALLCGLSVSVLASLISKYFGRFAAILTIVPIFAFGMNYIPITLSESLGLTLGCFAFILLWNGILEKKLFLAVAGIFMLTVALNARAGAFFVLPLLVVWMGRAFSSPSQKYHWRALGLSILALALALGFNVLLTALYGKPNVMPHANFAHTLFGLASGGKGWTHALEVYAKEFDSLKEGFAPILFTKSLELIIKTPFIFIEALLKNGSEAVTYLFSFSKIDPSDSNAIAILRKLFLILFIFGICKIKKHYKTNKNIFELILIGLIGSLLSACFIWNDGGLRSFAVSVPFFAAAFGIIISLINKPLSPTLENKTPHHWEGSLAVTISGILIVFSIFGPLIIQQDKHRLQEPQLSPTSTMIKIRNISKTPYLTISNDSEKSLGIPALTRMIDQDSFIKLNPYWSDTLPIFLELLDPKKFKQPITIGAVYDLASQAMIYVVGPRSIFESKQEYTELQAKPMVSSHKENFFASKVFVVQAKD